MPKTNYKIIRSLKGFIGVIRDITKNTPKGFFVFRGQGSHGESVQSGAYRRLSNTYDEKNVTVKIIEYHENIIEEVKKRCESHSIKRDECDMIVLGEIQHYGGATNLIDFTFNSLVALYFACKSKGDKRKKSKVYCLNTGSTEKFSEISSQNIDDPFRKLINDLEKKTIKSKPDKYYKWSPPFKNNRIIKQDSVFIFNGEGKINDNVFELICIIENGYKERILDELEKGYYISEESLFPDFVGYVEANSWYKPLEKIDVNYYFSKALDLQQKGELDEAIKYYEKILEIKPDIVEVLINLGVSYSIKDENDKAIKCLEKAVKINPIKDSAWDNLGYVYSIKKDNDEAIKCYKKALEINPKIESTWINIGLSYSEKGELDEAIKCYKKALELNPEYEDAWFNIGHAYSDKGEKEEAIKYYKKAVEIKPNYEDAWYNMGNTYLDKGELYEAVKCYEKALEINPIKVNALNNIGNVNMSNMKLDEAIKYFKKAIEIKPDEYKIWVNLGIAYFTKGVTDEAMKCYEKAIKINPYDENAFYNLGELYSKKGDKEKADEYFKKAEKLKK